MRYSRAMYAKERLRKLGYTQKELAEAVGYSRGYVSSVLNGAQSLPCMEAIEAQLAVWRADRKKEGAGRC